MYWNNGRNLLVVCLFALTRVLPAGQAEKASGEKIAAKGPGKCLSCHEQETEDRLSTPALSAAFDMHAKQGLGCADCHGGDPQAADKDLAHAKETGFVGQFDVRDIPPMCGRCHSSPGFIVTYNPGLATDQLEKYETSRHGELLGMGLRKVAHCASCHTAHNVRKASDPRSSVYPANIPRTCAHCHGDSTYMAGFPIPTDQFEKYAVSVHGIALLEREDLGAPACNDCHGNHGAVPPGAQSLAHVCGSCHAINMEMFEKGPHQEVFEVQQLPQCTVCHNHHSIAAPTARILNMEADSVCITCHRKDDVGWKEGKGMYAQVADLLALRDTVETSLDDAQKLGMDVSDGRFVMRDFRTSLFQLRTLSHELNLEAYTEKSEAAKSQLEKALEVGEGAIKEFHYRRKGLMISLLFALPVLLLLYLKVRALDADYAAVLESAHEGKDAAVHADTDDPNRARPPDSKID